MASIHVFTTHSYLYAQSFLRFIDDHFPGKHQFMVIGNDFDNNMNCFPRNLPNIIYIDSYVENHKEIMEYFLRSERIFYHYLSLPLKLQLLLLFRRTQLKKIYWIGWGADLYEWKDSISGNLKSRLAYFISDLFRKNIENYVGLFPPDIEYFKEKFGRRARTFYASYPEPLYNPVYEIYENELLAKTIPEKLQLGDPICIQIGHSCSASLNHVTAIKMLSRFLHANVHFYIPLSYGDPLYGDRVEEYAKNLLGNKVTCIRDLISKEDYMHFLSSIDIAVFNTHRQIGLGNIWPLLFFGKKIFLPSESVMFKYFREKCINIGKYEDIENMVFEELISQCKPELSNGKRYIIQHHLNLEKKVEMWSEVFNSNTNSKS